jgi:hypothetical protein
LRFGYLAVCNALLVLVACELGLRLFTATETRADGPARGRDDVTYTLHPFLQTAIPPSRITLPGPELAGWQVWPSDPNPGAERKRIMFIGGSTTACAYPFDVHEELEPTMPNTVYVFAADNHCTVHSLIKFWLYVDEVRPDLVVVLDCVNDFFRGFTSPDMSLPQFRSDYSHFCGQLFPFWSTGHARLDGRLVFYAKPSGRFSIYDERDNSVGGLIASLASDSLMLRKLGFAARMPQHPADAVDDAPMQPLRALPTFRRNISNLHRGCVAKRVKVVFLTMPFTIESRHNFLPPGNFFTNDGMHHLEPKDFVRGMRVFNAAIKAMCEDEQCPVIDLAARITDPALFRDEVHLHPEGQKLEAQIVADYIRSQSLLH